MILLADRMLDGAPGQETLGGLDITVRRNAFGRQVDSFEEDIHLAGSTRRCTPSSSGRRGWSRWATASRCSRRGGRPAAGRIVAVRQGPLMATSFHPEVGGGSRIHRLFVDLVAEHTRVAAADREVAMSGHSKWATTKHKKAVIDARAARCSPS
jgi:5'-phosphate synthase pdxT subunit